MTTYPPQDDSIFVTAKPKIEVKILDEAMRDQLPTYATPGSAALDLRACIKEPLVLQPGEVKLISTGLSIHIGDPGLVALIVPRSGLGTKAGIVLANTVGVIDSDYQGPLMIACMNRSAVAYTISPLDRIAQLMIVPVVQATFEVVTEFEATIRGEGGFGSTGKGVNADQPR